MSQCSCSRMRYTSSAVMCRRSPRWNTSRILSRGPVGFRPVLLSSSILGMGGAAGARGPAATIVWIISPLAPSPMHVLPSHAARAALAAAACALVAGCGSFDRASHGIAGAITPYKVEIVQGNFVSREQVNALKPGMSRQQVRDILGTPLIADAFHQQRWDYVFTIRRQGVPPQEHRLAVFFK